MPSWSAAAAANSGASQWNERRASADTVAAVPAFDQQLPVDTRAETQNS
jgi:hypothetical protein